MREFRVLEWCNITQFSDFLRQMKVLLQGEKRFTCNKGLYTIACCVLGCLDRLWLWVRRRIPAVSGFWEIDQFVYLLLLVNGDYSNAFILREYLHTLLNVFPYAVCICALGSRETPVLLDFELSSRPCAEYCVSVSNSKTSRYIWLFRTNTYLLISLQQELNTILSHDLFGFTFGSFHDLPLLTTTLLWTCIVSSITFNLNPWCAVGLEAI